MFIFKERGKPVNQWSCQNALQWVHRQFIEQYMWLETTIVLPCSILWNISLDFNQLCLRPFWLSMIWLYSAWFCRIFIVKYTHPLRSSCISLISCYLDCFIIWCSEKGLSITREVHTPYSCRVSLEYCAFTFSSDNRRENYVSLEYLTKIYWNQTHFSMV